MSPTSYQTAPPRVIKVKRRQPDLNWWSGSCSPMPYHLAMAPYNIVYANVSNLWYEKMTPTGFEPVLPPWKGGVLTTWPWSLVSLTASRSFWPPRAGLEPATTRLTAVRSTNWAIEDHFFLFFLFFPSIIPLMYLQNYIQNLSSNIFLTFFG